MQASSRRFAIGLTLSLGALLAVILAAPLGFAAIQVEQEQASPAELINFLPEPEQILVQRTSSFPSLGDTRLTVVLSSADVEELRKVTGRSDFAVIGSQDAQIIIRDDGRGSDPVAGDGQFSAIVSLSVAEAEERKTEEDAVLAKDSGEELVFNGRTLTTTRAPSSSFDADGFLAGQQVELRPAPAVVENETGGTTAEEPETTSNLAAAIPPKGASLPQMVVTGTNPFQDQVLMIRHLSVVQDPARTYDPCTDTGNPDGAWAFKHLMSEMANQSASGIAPGDFIRVWLEHWLSQQTINGDDVPTRSQMGQIISQWEDSNGELDLDKAPLRLLAIANRVDLARTTGSTSSYGGASTGDFVDAGELRFIFGFVVRPGDSTAGFITPVPVGNTGCHALPFTVILEYRVPKCECEGVRDWARRWVKLSQLSFPSSTYNARLERLTRQITRAGADPTKPNGSALGQLRTNEVALAPPWQLREFQLTQAPFSFLEETTVFDTPRDSSPPGFNQTTTFDSWVLNQIKPALVSANDFEGAVPPVRLLFPTSSDPFQGAHSNVPEANPNLITFHWDTTGAVNLDINTNPFNNWARHRASRAACSGCHRRETLTDFAHVDPTNLNKSFDNINNPPPNDASLPAGLSLFLTGINNLADPAAPNNDPRRDFDDLARRETDLKQKARMICSKAVVICRHCVLEHLQRNHVLPLDLTGGKGDTADHLSLAPENPLANRITEVH